MEEQTFSDDDNESEHVVIPSDPNSLDQSEAQQHNIQDSIVDESCDDPETGKTLAPFISFDGLSSYCSLPNTTAVWLLRSDFFLFPKTIQYLFTNLAN